jgi:prepilin-type N-terminal cleavage/methylation domain-containing protein
MTCAFSSSTQRPLRPRGFRPTRAGFTLVEMLVATTILGLMTTAVLGLFINMMKSYKYNAFRLSINRDVRTFTNEFSDAATASNYFVVLADFATRTSGASGSEVLAAMGDGEAGDCVLLVYKDDTDDTKVGRLVGYYYDAEYNGIGPTIRKFDLTFSPAIAASSLWTLMPATTTQHTNADILSEATGTITKTAATSMSGRLFYNFFNRSVMIKGQINYASNDGFTRRAVSTYNFTVSPRG